jgi:hypothetical protein
VSAHQIEPTTTVWRMLEYTSNESQMHFERISLSTKPDFEFHAHREDMHNVEALK